MTGTCDICDARDVELAIIHEGGIETWSCAEGCNSTRLRIIDEGRRDTQNAIRFNAQLTSIFDSIFGGRR